jgi:hypothetical protein
MLTAERRRGMLTCSPPSTIASVAVAIESALGYRYRHVWTATLPLAALLVERLGGAAGVLLPGLLASLGEMAAVREKASWPALQVSVKCTTPYEFIPPP